MKKYFILAVTVSCASFLFSGAFSSVLSGMYSGALASPLSKPSKRVEVYAISQHSTSQHYWDVTAGETLSGIVKQLLPDNPKLRKQLLREIMQLNPQAFRLNNPHNLQANTRLWLPGHAHSYIKRRKIKNPNYDVKSFSWGQLYKAKR